MHANIFTATLTLYWVFTMLAHKKGYLQKFLLNNLLKFQF